LNARANSRSDGSAAMMEFVIVSSATVAKTSPSPSLFDVGRQQSSRRLRDPLELPPDLSGASFSCYGETCSCGKHVAFEPTSMPLTTSKFHIPEKLPSWDGVHAAARDQYYCGGGQWGFITSFASQSSGGANPPAWIPGILRPPRSDRSNEPVVEIEFDSASGMTRYTVK